MAKRTGATSMVKAMRELCRLERKFGVGGILSRTGSPAIAAAVTSLSVACHVWEGLDNYPGESETVLPHGYEDPAGGGGGGSW